MQVLVRTDNHVAAHEQHLIRLAEGQVSTALARFAARLSRVDVHLSDESARKTIRGDKRCIVEARLVGSDPISASCQADTVGEALTCAIGKLKELLDSRLERLHAAKGGESIRH